ncbi:hypothetical protein NEDG_01371 [Nematocida displodere]|uniref:Uncharacterized protein n=1 Tax=Nematocida displodere TaxID=1805483 RepID=A0A177EBU7_9MICR|nr:hypothetical protein NEDG_01371 [Nematocida displodere]
MKGVLIEEIYSPPVIRGAGVFRGEGFIAYRNRLEWVAGSKLALSFSEEIEGVATSDAAIYVAVPEEVLVVEEGAVKRRCKLGGVERCKKVAASSKRVVLWAKNELAIYTFADKKILRYAPYGSTILSMDVVTVGKEDAVVLLLASSGCLVIREITVDKALEEASQISVSPETYRIVVLGRKRYLLIEPEKLTYLTDTAKKSVCFGGMQVRSACVTESGIVLSMVGGECCRVQVNEAAGEEEVAIDMYMHAEGIIEGMVSVSGGVVAYSTCGDVMKLEAGETVFSCLERGERVGAMKVVREHGRELVYLLKHTARGSVISRLSKKLATKPLARYALKERPLSVSGSEPGNALVVRYAASTDLLENGALSLSLGYTLAATTQNHAIQYLTENGLFTVLSQASQKKRVWCVGCRKEICKECGCALQVRAGAVDAHGAVAVLDTGVVYIDSTKSDAALVLDGYQCISAEMSHEKIVLGSLEDTRAIDRQTLKTETLPISGRKILPLSKNTYLVNTYEGALYTASTDGTKLADIRVGGTVVLRGIYKKSGAILITTNSALEVSQEKDKTLAEYLDEPDTTNTNPSTIVGASDGKYFRYTGSESFHTVSEEKREGVKIQDESITYKEEIAMFVPYGKYTVVIARLGSTLNTNGQIQPGKSFQAMLYAQNQLLSQHQETNAVPLDCTKVGKYIVVASNKEGGTPGISDIPRGQIHVLTAHHRGQLAVKYLIKVSGVVISLAAHGSTLLVGTNEGLRAYILQKDSFSEVDSRIGYKMAVECKVEQGMMLSIYSSMVKITNLTRAGKAPAPKNPKTTDSMFIDRIISTGKTVGALRKGFFCLGYTKESSGQILFINDEGKIHQKLGCIGLTEGVAEITAGNMGLVSRGGSVYVRLHTGDVLKISEVSEKLFQELAPHQQPKPENLFRVFALSPRVKQACTHKDTCTDLESVPKTFTQLHCLLE